MQFLVVLSNLFGWIYTACWSASFYSQPLLSFRRKSTSGTTVDFPFINTLGFLAYFVSNLAFYYSATIRQEYADRHGAAHFPTVAFNDIVFAGHGLLLCIVTTSQYLLPNVWGFDRSPGTRPSRPIVGAALGSVLAVLIVTVVVGTDAGSAATSWAWLDVVYTVSYVKLFVTLVKYAPQLYYNRQNKSTEGWSISQILLDFAGGTLSIAQQAIDSYLQHDWSGITGNPTKFLLGDVSMFYDILFMTQHYILYRGNGSPRAKTGEREREALLERGEDDRRLD